MSKTECSIGKFAMSLAVKDLPASLAFYQKLGFAPAAGDGKHWQVMKNGNVTLGLIAGMLEKNVLTFNPGWNADRENLESFTDVRELYKQIKDAGLEPFDATNLEGTGPASFKLTDPDGNPVYIDQHR